MKESGVSWFRVRTFRRSLYKTGQNSDSRRFLGKARPHEFELDCNLHLGKIGTTPLLRKKDGYGHAQPQGAQPQDVPNPEPGYQTGTAGAAIGLQVRIQIPTTPLRPPG